MAALAVLVISSPSVARLTCDEIDPLDVVPGAGVCTGVALDGETMTAYTEQELYAIIDGGAQVYLRHGFVAAAFQNYSIELSGEPVFYATLSVFNQRSEENALALASELLETGWWTPVTDWQGSGEAHVKTDLFSTTLQLREACFLGSILTNSTEAGGLEAARCLGETLVSLVQGQSPVDSATWGRIKASYQ